MDPLFDFTGKVVLVTGGSRGLGYQMVKAFAERANLVRHLLAVFEFAAGDDQVRPALGYQMVKAFAERGADLIIASRKLENCEKVADEVRALGRRALPFAAHCGRWADCDALIEATYDEFGRLDVLVNNAGMSPACPSHEIPESLFDSVVNLNFKGPFRLASQIGWRMSRGEGGSIINISSTGALMALPGVVPYGAAKAALNAMTVSLAAEYGPKVRVNAISAGPFRTDATKDWDEAGREA